MGNLNLQILKLVLVAGSLITVSGESQRDLPRRPFVNCTEFSSNITKISDSMKLRASHELSLEELGLLYPDNVFGAAPFFDQCTAINLENAEVHTVAAQFYESEFNMPLDRFQSIAQQCRTFESRPCKTFDTEKSKHPKYRPISGRGNNLKNPEWGTAGIPFLRFGSKNYEDKVYSIKRSVTGLGLPNPRTIVQELLSKAVLSPPAEYPWNLFTILSTLFVTHDVHYQVPYQPKNPSEEIRCCTRNQESVLPPTLLNAACLPIEISKNDSFYQHGNIGCLNMVRSQVAENTNQVESGEILNLATSYMDLSLIYGNHESELTPIRSYKNGTFRMGKNGVLPVDVNGQYIKPMKRFTDVPLACIWPSLLTRNHNQMAQRLAKLNPHWSDETLFQEARRINIANTNYNFVSTGMVDNAVNLTGVVVNETYSGVNPGTFIEFAISYRALHYYLRDHMLFINDQNETSQVAISDTIGNINYIVDNYDAALRGAMNVNVNNGQYSTELINKIGKDSKGFGYDLVAIDLQRARDHGCTSYLEMRRLCKFTPEINSFDDYRKIFNETNVNLLKSVYASHEDVDFYVGGLLEMFESIGNPFVSPVFGCIIGLGHNNYVQGDIYYYTHKENPYPFTAAQIASIRKYDLSSIICTNTGFKQTNLLWPYKTGPISPLVDCSTFPEMDLSPWKENPNQSCD